MDDAVKEIVCKRILYRQRQALHRKMRVEDPKELLTAAQVLEIKPQDVLITLDAETLKAVYECFVGKVVPQKSRQVLSAMVLQLQRELPNKIALQNEFCASVDRVMHTMRIPFVRGLDGAVKVRHWYELIGRPVDARCKVKVTGAHMILVTPGVTLLVWCVFCA